MAWRFPWPLIGTAAATAAQLLRDLKASREAMDQARQAVEHVLREQRRIGDGIHHELAAIREDMKPLLQLERRVDRLERMLDPDLDGPDLRLSPDAEEATRYGIPPRAPDSLPTKPRT